VPKLAAWAANKLTDHQEILVVIFVPVVRALAWKWLHL
jgi:hypothetical protein